MKNEIQKINNKGLTKTTSSKIDLLNSNFSVLSKGLAEIKIPRLFHQLVVFVLDASQSMTQEGLKGISKSEDVGRQISPIIKRLQESKNKNCFDISMWSFSSGYKEFMPLTPVTSIQTDNFDPCKHIGNYQTFIRPVLENVEIQVNDYIEKYKEKQCKALILILGDGDIHDYNKSIEIIDRLKSNSQVTIASYLFEDKKWKESLGEKTLKLLQENLSRFSSQYNGDPLYFFKSTIDAEEIRKHMIKSISTVSKID